ncbi:MAG: hypothetical protein H0T49_05965 [Chloroflexia bacterium]|nr:hypothetical protein [Chloroflexia bacterium]
MEHRAAQDAVASDDVTDSGSEPMLAQESNSTWFTARAQILLIGGAALGLIALMCVVVGVLILSRG